MLFRSVTAAFEFRNDSWLSEDVYDALRARNIALCIADSEKRETPAMTTADHAYFRLRDEGYQPADVERWGSTISSLDGTRDAYVYFKHEEQGKGPEFAALLKKTLNVER